MLFNKHKTAKTMPDKNELPTYTHQNIREHDTEIRQRQNRLLAVPVSFQFIQITKSLTQSNQTRTAGAEMWRMNENR